MLHSACRKGQNPHSSPIAMLFLFKQLVCLQRRAKVFFPGSGWGLKVGPSTCCNQESLSCLFQKCSQPHSGEWFLLLIVMCFCLFWCFCCSFESWGIDLGPAWWLDCFHISLPPSVPAFIKADLRRQQANLENEQTVSKLPFNPCCAGAISSGQHSTSLFF